MTQLVRKTDDEAGALVRLGFEELRGFTESIGHDGARHRGAGVRLRPRRAGRSSSCTTRSPAASSARSAARPRAAGRGAADAGRAPPAARAPAVGDAARRPRDLRPQRPGRRPARARGQPAAPADGGPRRRPPRPAASGRAGRGVPGRDAAARRLPPRPHGVRARLAPRRPRGLRHAARPRPRLHARLRPLQHRPPHLRERALAVRPARGASSPSGRSRSRRSRSSAHSMGGLVVAQRLPLRGARGGGVGRERPPRDLARLAAHGRAARAGRALAELGLHGCPRRA